MVALSYRWCRAILQIGACKKKQQRMVCDVLHCHLPGEKATAERTKQAIGARCIWIIRTEGGVRKLQSREWLYSLSGESLYTWMQRVSKVTACQPLLFCFHWSTIRIAKRSWLIDRHTLWQAQSPEPLVQKNDWKWILLKAVTTGNRPCPLFHRSHFSSQCILSFTKKKKCAEV